MQNRIFINKITSLCGNYKAFKALVCAVFLFFVCSCNYLDVIPDNTATIDDEFKNRYEAEGFLYGCFSYLPSFADAGANPALLGGDEVWYIDPADGFSPRLWYIALGRQGTNTPYANYWASQQNVATSENLYGGTAIFTALSDCNIFLENIDKPYDLGDYERDRWIGEVKFIKAFYHFWLLRMYGPVPLIKENRPISAKGEDAQIYREPVDEVVDYIVSLLDEAVETLPPYIEDQLRELGRPTKPIALALKAQTLTLAASPLFNGTATTPPAFSRVDNRGIQLFPQTYSAEKWQKAATALKEAIDAAHEGNHKLYDFREKNPVYAAAMNEKSILAMQVRGAVTERWNEEIVWGDSRSNTNTLQSACLPVFYMEQNGGALLKSYAPTFRTVEQFYTKNGIPIEDDDEWVGIDPMELRTATADDKYYIQQNFQTIRLHFDREARFYASIIFDGGTLYGNSRYVNDANPWVTLLKSGQISGGRGPTQRYSSTGYLCKKLLHYMSSSPASVNSFSQYRYAFPIIRLADLYLMYAEALNEAYGPTHPDVYQYIDTVRARSGLKGVVESWNTFAIASKKDKPLSQDGMRDIIRRERLNELAFEGVRFWDLKRWKLAEEYMNRPIRGLNIDGETAADFYQVTELYSVQYEQKDYLWPIKQSNLLKNKNLIQNPGW
ncbi:MAG: RagB/SusD family nutrient uptake outer membrane protein [Prevotellaceae bacterium]|jgi:hypothetical protein|nr:RagB/SusD family nutrient uptake outer membrane protein [Prevotellaceae bacterium]